MAGDMKVSEVLAARLQNITAAPKAGKADFSFTLSKVGDDDLVQRLTSMMETIATQGKRLSQHMDMSDMLHYRGLIGEFIQEVVGRSHKFSRENFLDRRGRHRVYGIIRLVDKNLDELAQELLKSEKDHLKILSLIDEINGLLLDIFA